LSNLPVKRKLSNGIATLGVNYSLLYAKIPSEKGKMVEKINLEKAEPLIKLALREDIGRGDITTQAIISEQAKVQAVIKSKQTGIVTGLPVSKAVFNLVDEKIKFLPLVEEGSKVKNNQNIAHLEGKARGILTGERTALNFLAQLSGIATLTRKYVEKVKPYRAKILDTRKTTPGLRHLEKYAVRMGGGHNHRMGLYDMVLIKDNHIKMQNAPREIQGISGTKSSESFQDSRGKCKMQKLVGLARENVPKGTKIELEVVNLQELKEALETPVDIIMLDNMNLVTIRKAMELFRQHYKSGSKRPQVEVSGKVNLNNVRRIARTGVDRISVGELTHSAKVMDISLEVI